MSDVKPLTEQEEQRPKYEMTLACLLSQVALVDAPETVDDDQGPFVSERDAVRLANAAHRWFSANNATLDALRAELATVKAERDHYKAEAMAARKAFDAARKAAIELCDMNGMAGRAGGAARAIRAENVKAEGACTKYPNDGRDGAQIIADAGMNEMGK